MTKSSPNDPHGGSELAPVETPAKSDGDPENLTEFETNSEIAAIQLERAKTDGKRQIEWPIIRSQQELKENAELQHRGENIYPMQGKKIGAILIHYGVIDEQTLRVVRSIQKKPLYRNQPMGDILVRIGIIKQDELPRSLLIQAGIPMVDILSIDIPSEVTKIIPLAHIRDKRAVPIGIYNNALYLAVTDPFMFTDNSFFMMLTGMKVIPVFAPMHEIVRRINLHDSGKKSTEEVKAEFLNLAKNDVADPAVQPVADETSNSDVSESDSIIVNLVNQMIIHAIQEGTSDIHIELFNDGAEASIRLRRDGRMEHFASFPRVYHKAVVSRIKIMAGLDISDKRRPQDGKISFNVPHGGRVDLRVATIPATQGVEFVTIRILASGDPLPLDTLGMANRDVSVFREVFQLPYGLILVCGPTGSGKTTTLHSVLKELNSEDRKIWTAEDPVEIVQPRLCQVQVNNKIGVTFATVLRAFLRADPDVIMIGEMRDQETAKIALEASMTGHLVLSTLHTNSASETVARLLGLGIDPYNLSDALLAVLAQRLARKLCTACVKREEASDSDIEYLANEYYQSGHAKPPTIAERNDIIKGWRENFGVDGKIYLGRPVGCKLCNGGYKGRIGLYELLQATPSLRHLIRQQSAASEYQASGVAEGMRTLKQDGIEKVIRGITDMMQVYGACM